MIIIYSEEIVYYNVVDNLLYRQDTEKTKCYPADATIDLITGEETLLEGRTNVYGDPYSEIDGDFPGVITIE